MGRFIDKVGIEVECGVTNRTSIDGFNVHGDGSLRRSSENRRLRDIAEIPAESGESVTLSEYVSNPVSYPEGIEEVLEPGLDTLYSDYINDINPTMGLHIHVSLNKEVYYRRLQSKKFEDYYLEKMENSDLADKVEELRRRLNDNGRGRSNYCQKHPNGKNIDKQLGKISGGGGRYYHLNFSNRRRSRNTIEFRTFPAMPSKDCVLEAVELVTTAINGYLLKGDWFRSKTETAASKSKTKKHVEIDAFNNVEERKIPER